jgi:hypothetical protein
MSTLDQGQRDTLIADCNSAHERPAVTTAPNWTLTLNRVREGSWVFSAHPSPPGREATDQDLTDLDGIVLDVYLATGQVGDVPPPKHRNPAREDMRWWTWDIP